MSTTNLAPDGRTPPTPAAAPQRGLFGSGGELAKEIQRAVETSLTAAAKRRGKAQLYRKAAVSIGLMVAAWSVLILASPGPVLALACLAGLVAGAVLTGFCVQHDANHGASFATRRHNRMLGLTADALLGFSSYTWRVKHNVAHHTYTNIAGYDVDINQTPFAKLVPVQRSRPWYRLQHLYIWPLYSFMGLRMQVWSDFPALAGGKVGQSPIHRARGWDLAGLLAGKLTFIVWAIVVPLLVYPWFTVLAAYLGVLLAIGLIMSVVFQLAHSVQEASRGSAEQVLETPRTWVAHQIETTADFCPGNRFLTWSLGGLNYQIEHHLFPRMPHTLYPEIAGIVRAAAERHGVSYNCQPSLWRAVRSHFRHLRAMGRLGIAPEIEMG